MASTLTAVQKRKVKIYVQCGKTDMRNGVYALHKKCKETYIQFMTTVKKPSSKVRFYVRPAFFAFCNKNKTKMRIIVICGKKYHMIQDNVADIRHECFGWWPDSAVQLKRTIKTVQQELRTIVESHGFTV